MNWQGIKDHLIAQKLPQYRLDQVFRAYFTELQPSWESVTTLSKAMRDELSAKFPWESVVVDQTQESDDVIKFKFKLHDGYAIETVVMKHLDGRRTICVSCQVGCPMACTFCATGTMGLKRQLPSYEIYEQVIAAARMLKSRGEHLTNVVFMGMGEPMQNFDAVKEAIETLHDGNGFNMGWRHFTISTSGLVVGINRQAKELPQVNLAVSLHAADDDVRTRLMPVNRAFPLAKLMATCVEYANETNRRVFFEYLMLEGLNDTPELARELAKLMKKHPLFHVNLIRYHYTGYVDPKTSQAYKCSSRERINTFMAILEKEGVSVTLRRSFGEKIDAACGQLVIKELVKAKTV